MGLEISAIICTYNRAGYLRQALQSLAAQTLAKEQFEVIVVDNGSTDDTKRVVQEEFVELPNLRYLSEPILGVNRARNTGWRNANSPYVAYLDDDIIVYPNWLETILDVFATVKPEPACVGGKVEPIWPASKPTWLSDTIAPFLAIVDICDTPTMLTENQMLVSANIAFPRYILETVCDFHVYLGRKGNRLRSMDENLLQEHLSKQGLSRYYHPNIAVRHHVHVSRLSKRWFTQRMYWEGVSEAIAQLHRDTPTIAERARIALNTASQLARSPRRLARLALPTNDPDRFARKCTDWLAIGYLAGLSGVSR